MQHCNLQKDLGRINQHGQAMEGDAGRSESLVEAPATIGRRNAALMEGRQQTHQDIRHVLQEPRPCLNYERTETVRPPPPRISLSIRKTPTRKGRLDSPARAAGGCDRKVEAD